MSQNRIFSTDSAKAVKAGEYGYLNAIHYMAPARSSGVANLCVNASPGCIALCLGRFSGHASMVSDLENGTNPTRESRKQKAIRFMSDRAAYILDMVREIDLLRARAGRDGQKLCVRLNGSTDIPYEGIRFSIERDRAGRATQVKLGGLRGENVFQHYRGIQFVDYTKIFRRFDRALPANYSLTFSRSELNDVDCLRLLSRGHNVAIVFAGAKPATWHDYRVIDGDAHDLRHLDPRGVVIGLSPKGARAKNDSSGFVVR